MINPCIKATKPAFQYLGSCSDARVDACSCVRRSRQFAIMALSCSNGEPGASATASNNMECQPDEVPLKEWLRRPVLQGSEGTKRYKSFLTSLSPQTEWQAARPPAVRSWQDFLQQAETCLEAWLDTSIPASLLPLVDIDQDITDATTIAEARLVTGICMATLVLGISSPTSVFSVGKPTLTKPKDDRGTLIWYGGQKKMATMQFSDAEYHKLNHFNEYNGDSEHDPFINRLIERVHGHLIWRGVSYGVFVTKETCTFVQIDSHDGSLMISPSIRHDAEGFTAKHGMLYVLNLAIKQEPFDMLSKIGPRKILSSVSLNNGIHIPFIELPDNQTIRVEDIEWGDVLGAGNAAEVYEATMANVPLAIKIAYVGGMHGSNDCSFTLSREIKVYESLKALQGSVIPKVHAYGMLQNRAGDHLPFLALERIDGDTLDTAIYKMSDEAVPGAIKSVMAAFEKLHAAGYIQGSVKPLNVMLRQDGSAVIIDFGRGEELVCSSTQSTEVNVCYRFAEEDCLSREERKVRTMLTDWLTMRLKMTQGEAPRDIKQWEKDVKNAIEAQATTAT